MQIFKNLKEEHHCRHRAEKSNGTLLNLAVQRNRKKGRGWGGGTAGRGGRDRQGLDK